MKKQRPNILFLLADQHRRDWLGHSSNIPVRTPHLDTLTERGTKFTNAITPSPVCAPARACLASGREYLNNPVADNSDDFPTTEKTYFRGLRDRAGYYVATCGKLDLHKNTYDWGIDGQSRLSQWGFSDGMDIAGQVDALLSLVLDTHPAGISDFNMREALSNALRRIKNGDISPADPYTATLRSEDLLEAFGNDYYLRYRSENVYQNTFPSPLPPEYFQDNWIAKQALSLLEDMPREKPWHLSVNFAGPHPPMDVTQDMHQWYRDPAVTFPLPAGVDSSALSEETHQEIRRNYAAKIENIDHWIGRFVTELTRRGELEGTIIIYASDHGEMLGDGGYWGKGVPYQSSVGIPLIIAGPGIEAQVSDTPVSLLDLHATIRSWGDLSTSVPTESVSLRPVLSGQSKQTRDLVFSAYRDWQAVFDGRYELVERIDREAEAERSQELYDFERGTKHPKEQLVENPAEKTLRRLHDRLEAHWSNSESASRD